MTGEDFPHPSRAGHYGIRFTPELLAYLAAVAGALVPGSDEYPSGRQAQVSTFIQDRSSAQDQVLLEGLMVRWPADSDPEATRAVQAMEEGDPSSFAYLRELVFHGYYSSHRVLAVMADRGYAYHGAPQPLGYKITDVMAVPTKSRGSYIPTSDVHHVSH